MTEDMVILTRMFDLLAWLLPKHERFPRLYRSTFTKRMILDSSVENADKITSL